jgi:hypothetical protein
MKRITRKKALWSLVLGGCFLLSNSSTYAAEEHGELAQKLANPIANLISVPLQLNYDENIGIDDEGSKYLLNVQPVIPFSIGEDWNIITRTIFPLVNNNDIPVDGAGESGLGDIVASQFFSPKNVTSRGWTWGVGPIWLLPSATDETLGGEKWGLGPTGVALKQLGPWTYGILANHLWSFAGEDERSDINSTYVQPFASFVTKTHTTLALSTESTYDWEQEEWSVPVICTLAQMIKIGKLPMQISLAAKYWADSPENGPEGWGGRIQFTFIFPR